MTIWSPVMFRDELDMLRCRLETMQDYDVQHVIVESKVTHRGIPKSLHFQENQEAFAPWADQIIHVVADLPDGSPWEREHAQRNAAWPYINARARNADTVLITDLDEIPSPALLDWKGPGVISARMKTTLFAVDWLVPDAVLPPTCVAATAGWLRQSAAFGDMGLAEVRDARDRWPELADGGWHFSWTGGPERQRQKLLTATCHTELLGTPEGDMILDGTRYRTSEDGGGLPVVPVDMDESWPAYIWERRCPAEWFRPRENA
jgi:beta-1,4-mannosyl-glycoprotein beta-1,4-N-acetylglucosaminyltransferase